MYFLWEFLLISPQSVIQKGKLSLPFKKHVSFTSLQFHIKASLKCFSILSHRYSQKHLHLFQSSYRMLFKLKITVYPSVYSFNACSFLYSLLHFFEFLATFVNIRGSVFNGILNILLQLFIFLLNRRRCLKQLLYICLLYCHIFYFIISILV